MPPRGDARDRHLVLAVKCVRQAFPGPTRPIDAIGTRLAVEDLQYSCLGLLDASQIRRLASFSRAESRLAISFVGCYPPFDSRLGNANARAKLGSRSAGGPIFP